VQERRLSNSAKSMVSTSDAARNLKLMKAKNPEYAEIDPTDESQLKCYKLLRMVSSKVFPGPFMQAWKKQRLDVTTGVRYKQEFWMVPWVNFPAGLPRAVKDLVVSEEELASMRDTSGHAINPGQHWLVDTECKREGLGRRVTTVECFIDASTKFKNVGHPKDLEDSGEKRSGAHAVDADPGPGGLGSARHGGAEPVHDACVEASSKKNNPFKERFTTLRAKLETAFQDEHIWSDDPLDYFHAGAWASAVVEAVESMPDGPARKAVSDKFLELLTSLLLSHRCFLVL
jgi:hypothetical protein